MQATTRNTRVHQTGRVTPVYAASTIVTGNRIPRDFFSTTGVGESDITVHAGSYHLALQDAGIEVCNIMTYSSILPGIAREVEKPALVHGAVMESIMAVANGRRGEPCMAGIIYGWLYDKSTGERFGGLVCEHNGSYAEGEIRAKLNLSLDELYQNGFTGRYDMRDVTCMTRGFVPEKEYGTALVAMCFTSYVHPVLQAA